MKLPATIAETLAAQTAREVLEGDANIPWGEEAYGYSEDESRRFTRNLMKRFITIQPANLMTVVEFAKGGWGLADEVLREVILEHLNSGVAMPTYLAAYNMDIAAGNLPQKRPARQRENNFLRDCRIAIAILLVMEKCNMRSTRNPTTQKRPSACSVVTEVLNARGINVTEAAVVAIWQRMKKSL